jgi:hypothetical protein
MAYSNENVCVVYTGDNSNTIFGITFDFVEDTSVVAELWDVSDPLNPTNLPITNPTDWVVDGNTVVTAVAPSADQKLLLFRQTKPVHAIEYSTYEFPYVTANLDLDTVYQIAQENRDALNRALLNSQYAACTGATLYTIEDLQALAVQVSELATQTDAFQTQLDANTLGVSNNSTSISNNNTAISNNSLVIADNVSRIVALESASNVYSLILAVAPSTIEAVATDRIVVKSAGVIINLPAVPVAKDQILVKDRGGNEITVNGNGATIDGSASIVLNSNEASVNLLFDGSEWLVI